jgi:transcriptional regulator with XRE-family HTH domain
LREQRKFGERVRSLREKAGLTQEQAAERIGIHPKHLGRIEGGTVNVTFGTLIALAVAYQVSAEDLFAESGRAAKKR